jgi:hypothetical protein
MADVFLGSEQARLKKNFWCDLDASARSQKPPDAAD